jgi:hypothetical protein
MEEIEKNKGNRNFKYLFFQELKGVSRNPMVYHNTKGQYDEEEKVPEEIKLNMVYDVNKLISKQKENNQIAGHNLCQKTTNNTEITPFYTPFGKDDRTLVFESRFE